MARFILDPTKTDRMSVRRLASSPLNSLVGFLSVALLVFLPFTSLFAPLPWLSLSLFILIVLSLVFAVTQVFCPYPIRITMFGFDDYLIGVLLAWWSFMGMLASNSHTVFYVGLYFVVFGLGYVTLKMCLDSNLSESTLLRANLVGVLSASAFSVADFAFFLGLGIDIQQGLPRTTEASALYLGFLPRAYGPAEEPTILVYYLNCMGPLAIWSSRRFLPIMWVRHLSIGVIVLAWFLTLSIAGYVFLAVSAAFWLSLSRISLTRNVSIAFSPRSLLRLKRALLIVALAVVFGAVAIHENHDEVSHGFDQAAVAISPLVKKVSFGDVSSANQRIERWMASIDQIANHPLIGRGPGFFSSRDQSSSINWYLFLTTEGGPVTLFLILAIIGVWHVRVLSSDLDWRIPALIGLTASAMHFIVISTIQAYFMWVLMALAISSLSRPHIASRKSEE